MNQYRMIMRTAAKQNIIKSILLMLFALFSATATLGAQVKITASLDSATLLMGKQTVLHLEILQQGDQEGIIVEHQNGEGNILTENVELIDILRSDTTDLGNDRRQINRDYLIQSFDSGFYSIPPFLYVLDADTFKSNTLALKVMPVNVDTLKTIHGYAPIESIRSKWYDFIPDFITDNWLWILIGIIIIAGIVMAVLMKRQQSAVAAPKEKPVPPYDLAIKLLNELHEENLCERGQEKEFYTRLTEILREYLFGRFGINAMEMTTTQIIGILSKSEETKQPNRYMKQILEVADFVKFAKVRPLPDDNQRSFRSALQFVEDTRPAPLPEESSQAPAKENVEPSEKEK